MDLSVIIKIIKRIFRRYRDAADQAMVDRWDYLDSQPYLVAKSPRSAYELAPQRRNLDK